MKELEVQEFTDDIVQSLIIAMSRTQFELLNLDDTCQLIKNEFRFLSLREVRKAITKGTAGEYGRSYKLSTQEVCYWIQQYVKDKNAKTLKL